MQITARKPFTSYTFALLLPLVMMLFTTAVRGETTQQAFERLATQFQFLGVKELLHDRQKIHLADPVAMEVYLPLLEEFRTRTDKASDVLPLLKHADPKVRLLSIMALYLKGEARTLPDIATLVDDRAETYPDPPVDREGLRFSGIGPPREPRTVGEAARLVLQTYMGGVYSKQAFDAYWAERKDLEYCAGWFEVQLGRATQRTIPMPAGSFDRIQKLRKEIDRVPEEQRKWVLLDLARREEQQYGTAYLLREGELSRLSRSIGSATLRAMISTPGFVTPAPDVRGDQIRWFVLKHAMDLLTADDAEAVLKAGAPILAAQLRPEMASAWLRAALPDKSTGFDSWGDAQKAAALWAICGASEIDFLVDWYFARQTAGGSTPSARAAFLQAVVAEPRVELRHLLARIIRDPRFTDTGPESVRTLVEIINPWVQEPLASRQEIHEAYGYDELQERRVFAPLAEWQKRLRNSLPEWAPER